MTFTRLAQAVVDAIKSMASLSRAGSLSPSYLRLDDLASLRAPAEDLGMVDVSVYEASPRPVKSVNPLPFRTSTRSTPRVAFAGVDSSARHIETSVAGIVVSAVSISSRGPVEVLDWPPVHEYPHPTPIGPPFIRILPNTSEPAATEAPPWVTLRNPAGVPYDRDYSMAQAMDEARVELENWALTVIPEVMRGPGGLVVFVDGPLFTVPGALAQPGAPEGVKEAWRALVAGRVEAVRKVEESGGVVIGVVKRLSRSRILSRVVDGGPCGSAENQTDELYITRAVASGCAGWSPGRVYKTVKIRVRHPLLPGVPPKIVEYLAIPPGAWHGGPRGLLIVRIEYTEQGLEMLRLWGLEPLHAYALATVNLESKLPIPLLASDKRARSITAALRRLLSEEAARVGIPLDYESLVEEAGEGWRRAAAY